jgi:hypothetical protein
MSRFPVEGVRVRVAKLHAPVRHDVSEVAVTVGRGSLEAIGSPDSHV